MTTLSALYTAVLGHVVTVRKLSAVISAVRFFAPHSTNDSTFYTIRQHFITMLLLRRLVVSKAATLAASATALTSPVSNTPLPAI